MSLDPHLVDIEVLPEEGGLLGGTLLAVIDENVPEGGCRIVRLLECIGLPADGEVDVVFRQRPALPTIHLQSLAVAAQRMPPLKRESAQKQRTRVKDRGQE